MKWSQSAVIQDSLVSVPSSPSLLWSHSFHPDEMKATSQRIRPFRDTEQMLSSHVSTSFTDIMAAFQSSRFFSMAAVCSLHGAVCLNSSQWPCMFSAIYFLKNTRISMLYYIISFKMGHIIKIITKHNNIQDKWSVWLTSFWSLTL